MRECSSSVPVKCIRLPARHFANLNALSLTVHDLVLVSLFKGEDEADETYSDRTTSKHGTKECRWSGTTSEPEERDRAQTTDGQLSKHQTRPRSRAIGDTRQNITLRKQCHHREVITDNRDPDGCAFYTTYGVSTAGLRPALILSRPSCRRSIQDEDHAVSDRPHHRVPRLQSALDIAQPAFRRRSRRSRTHGGVHEERSRAQGQWNGRGQQGASSTKSQDYRWRELRPNTEADM